MINVMRSIVGRLHGLYGQLVFWPCILIYYTSSLFVRSYLVV